jgi:hypothetical protein
LIVGPLIGGALAGLLVNSLLPLRQQQPRNNTPPASGEFAGRNTSRPGIFQQNITYMEVTPMTDYILSIDQGTTSTAPSSSTMPARSPSGQLEHEQIFPSPAGSNTTRRKFGTTPEVIGQALSKANITRHNITAVGITNQRDRGRVG